MFRKIVRWHPPLMPVLVSLAAAGVVPATDLPTRAEPAVAAVLARAHHLVVQPERPPVTARARARGTRSFRAA
ncbi:hypothetical protein ACFFQW_17290 [Umezawaea endophytica]|uniref:Uncharacterized protein n=1 Tax=Umezawaea endophytica TaxID=1654476 RepID=A0A9X3AKE3_9PSEU|nr:hypothetical protein [Umezawaea endophytica]MCS7482745.1 hypothetical protein [Umezawaea endophytica]